MGRTWRSCRQEVQELTRTHWSLTHLLAAVALMTAFCGRVPGAAVTEQVERSLSLADGGTVAVKTTNGSLRVAGVEGDQVRIRAVKRARTAEDLERITIDIEESPDRISIEATKLRGVRNASVSFELEIPHAAGIQATTVNGSIRITGTGGEARAETVNGSVRIADHAGSLAVETVNGSVRVGWSGLPTAGSNSIKTVNGSVEASLPAGSGGRFKAKTVNGSIKTDLPLEVRKGRSGRFASIDDQIGEGGPEFLVSTVNGAVRLFSD